ncbi:MAG: hypothetical protein AAFS10_04310, partial [Myxococcota bacterium]
MFTVLVPDTVVQATVSGTPLTRFRDFRVFGDAVSTGNTLMSNTPSQPLVNSILLDESAARISGIPQDSTIEGAFLFWSGSVQFGPDRDAVLTLADGATRDVSAADCFESPVLGGFFYCRAEVTDLVSDHPASPGNFNGLYSVGDVRARAAALDENGECINPNCQARYAGWSLVVVYANPTVTLQKDIVIYDGFRQLDETINSAGIDSFVIDGFQVANPPQGTFRFFGLEGDALLGVPPQDLDANPDLRCDTCFDYISFNGVKLSDPNNPPNNIFNSTTPSGGALGVDIDTFDVSSLVNVGDTSVLIEVGSGDGIPTAQGGGGESVFLGYTILSLNRLSPNFQTVNTFKAVDPQEAGPGETVFFTINVANEGSLEATNVRVSDVLDGNLEYVAGSTRVDGMAIPDGPGGSFPLAGGGLNLGTLSFQGDNDRRVTFRARVREGTPSGTRIPNVALVDSSQTNPGQTNEVVITTRAPELGQPTKTFQDSNGDPAEPGDLITYTIFIPNASDRTASGIRFVDDMPRFAQLRNVTASPGTNLSNVNGGINGTGRVEIGDIIIPAAINGVFISYTVQIFTVEELINAGVDPADIDGLTIVNQGRVTAPFLATNLFTDDPGTAATPD